MLNAHKPLESDMTKIDALSEARKIASTNGYAFAIERHDGTWYAAANKPSLRSGKVLEVRDGGQGEYYA